jgi:hypothetical protein
LEVNDENKIIDDVQTVDQPKAGMLFSSLDELSTYYEMYAKQQGFAMVKRNRKYDAHGNTRYITLACGRQGSRKGKETSNEFSKPIQTIRVECKANLNAKLVDTKWYVTSVCIDHNHALSPGKARFHRCHKKLDSYAKKKLLLNDDSGIGMSKNFNSLVIEAGGYENLTFGEKECRNFIAKERYLQLGTGGAGALRDYFIRMQSINDGFYFAMDFDDDGRLKNVFWADARSRAAYEDFGDVVTFDTTYLTNKYEMPFAPFVGVNHHGQSILFGAALISKENTETFVWLFETWLKCMNGRSPNAIITDQDRAMKNAINVVFPNAQHRLCLWHILKKLPDKFGSHLEYHAIKSALRKCVYESETCDEFDVNWQSLLGCYNLKDNAWLCGLYSERNFWVPAYLKDVFWAGMTTTQKSESMNAFFDGYVHPSTTLKEFVDGYDNALHKKVENENIADFKSFNSTIACVSKFSFEKKFQQLYTNTKFKEVQEEIKEVMYCSVDLIKREGTIFTYEVAERVELIGDYVKKVSFTVEYSEPCEVKCGCCMFESRGILCKHVISVLIKVDVTSLLEKYFLNRWRKDLKRKYKFIKSSYDPLKGNPSADRCFDLCKDMHVLAELASTTPENYMKMKDHIRMLTNKLSGSGCEYHLPSEALPPSEPLLVGSASQLSVTGTMVESNQVHSPLVKRTRGKPPSTRLASAVEKAVVKKSQRRKNQSSDINPTVNRRAKKVK